MKFLYKHAMSFIVAALCATLVSCFGMQSQQGLTKEKILETQRGCEAMLNATVTSNGGGQKIESKAWTVDLKKLKHLLSHEDYHEDTLFYMYCKDLELIVEDSDNHSQESCKRLDYKTYKANCIHHKLFRNLVVIPLYKFFNPYIKLIINDREEILELVNVLFNTIKEKEEALVWDRAITGNYNLLKEIFTTYQSEHASQSHGTPRFESKYSRQQHNDGTKPGPNSTTPGRIKLTADNVRILPNLVTDKELIEFSQRYRNHSFVLINQGVQPQINVQKQKINSTTIEEDDITIINENTTSESYIFVIPMRCETSIQNLFNKGLNMVFVEKGTNLEIGCKTCRELPKVKTLSKALVVAQHGSGGEFDSLSSLSVTPFKIVSSTHSSQKCEESTWSLLPSLSTVNKVVNVTCWTLPLAVCSLTLLADGETPSEIATNPGHIILTTLGGGFLFGLKETGFYIAGCVGNYFSDDEKIKL